MINFHEMAFSKDAFGIRVQRLIDRAFSHYCKLQMLKGEFSQVISPDGKVPNFLRYVGDNENSWSKTVMASIMELARILQNSTLKSSTKEEEFRSAVENISPRVDFYDYIETALSKSTNLIKEVQGAFEDFLLSGQEFETLGWYIRFIELMEFLCPDGDTTLYSLEDVRDRVRDLLERI